MHFSCTFLQSSSFLLPIAFILNERSLIHAGFLLWTLLFSSFCLLSTLSACKSWFQKRGGSGTFWNGSTVWNKKKSEKMPKEIQHKMSTGGFVGILIDTACLELSSIWEMPSTIFGLFWTFSNISMSFFCSYSTPFHQALTVQTTL